MLMIAASATFWMIRCLAFFLQLACPTGSASIFGWIISPLTYGSTSHKASKDIIRTCQDTQLGPLSPSPLTFVMSPSRVLISSMEGAATVTAAAVAMGVASRRVGVTVDVDISDNYEVGI